MRAPTLTALLSTCMLGVYQPSLTTVKEATGKNVYFTEQYTDVNGDFNGDMGWHMENVLIGSLNNWSKCVLEWNLATDSSYGPHTQFGCSDCLGALTIQSETQYDTNVSYYIVGHASKFIQPDAVRINVTTSSSKLLVTGFKNPDNTLAILAYNYWGGLDDAEDIELVIGSQKMDFTIPPRSTVTFAVSNSDEAFVQEVYQNQARELVKIIDLTGRETGFKPNCPLIYMYSDGTHQRVMKSAMVLVSLLDQIRVEGVRLLSCWVHLEGFFQDFALFPGEHRLAIVVNKQDVA